MVKIAQALAAVIPTSHSSQPRPLLRSRAPRSSARRGDRAMKTFDVQSIGILASRTRVFELVAEPANLPKWASAFKCADNRSARLQTPQGTAAIALGTDSRRDAGTIDWTMTFPDGSVGTAYARVTPDGENRSLLVCAHGAARPVGSRAGSAQCATQDPCGRARALEDNPRSQMIKLDPDPVAAARQGSRAALEAGSFAATAGLQPRDPDVGQPARRRGRHARNPDQGGHASG